VDLWLHGYALLQRDTARVPFFRRGYREQMLARRSQLGVTTALDVNRERLASRLAANPALVNGQFLPLYFASLDDLRRVVELTLQVQGDPRGAGDARLAQYVALVNGSFPTAADRDWLRTFMQSLTDEHRVFYRGHWVEQQRARAGARAAVDSLWAVHRPAFRRWLSNTQQDRGEMLLSLPLNGEGRTTDVGGRYYVIAVNHPDTPAAAAEALYTFAHEAVITVATTAVNDNVTPAQQRSGESANYTANAAVRGGLLLVERVAPALAQGYMRYYVTSAGGRAPTGDPRAMFESTYALPPAMLAAIRAQMEAVLGGI